MHDIRRLGLQVFAAPNNLTGEVQIEVKAREIDFVTSFGKNLKSLLDILGITRMIRKENNSVLKTKTVKGELQSGDVGEGEEIPMSRYTVEEKPFDTIKIEKYRKGVSLEAISEKGYEAAVQDTDDEFKSDLQNVVTDKFYAQLKAGSLTGHETTWQMAVDYKGTYKAHPTFEAVMENGENGFVGFVDQDKHILQFGNIEEEDGETYKENETLATL